MQAEIARLNDSLNSLRNRLNDEFLKNKKNTKLMIGLHKENKDQILKRSSTYENDEKDIEKNSNMLPFSQTSVKSRINGFEFEARTEESVKKYSIDLDENEKSDQNKKSEDYIENSSKNEEFNGDIAKANDKELQQENNKKPINSKIETNFEESGKSEAKKQNEKKIIQKAKSKKSVFSKQPSAKTFLKSASKDIKEENTLVDSKQNEKNLQKNIIEKIHENSYKFKKKNMVSFHEKESSQTSDNSQTKELLEKYIENLNLRSSDDKTQLKIFIKKLSKAQKNKKTYENLQKIIEDQEIDVNELLSIKQKYELLLKNNDNLKCKPIKNDQMLNSIQNDQSATRKLKNLMKKPHKENSFDNIFYQEFLKFKQENNLDLLKNLIKNRIDQSKEKNLEKDDNYHFIPYRDAENNNFQIYHNNNNLNNNDNNTGKNGLTIPTQKQKSKSIPSLAELNFINPFENKILTNKIHSTLSYSKENMIMYRTLRTESGPRTAKYIGNQTFFQPIKLSQEKDKILWRRSSNYDNNDKNNYENPMEIETLKQNHNHKEEEIIEDNFSKNKKLYKYPFKSIHNKYEVKDNETDFDYSFDAFEKIYRNLIAKHEKCGSSCDHLKRFYNRIGFVNRFNHKEELYMQKNIIDKLNFPEEV